MLCRDGCVRKVYWYWASVALGALVIAKADLAIAQTSYERGEGQQGQAQTEMNQQVRGSSGGSSVHVVPTITVSERYDSNIFAGAGVQKSDFITDIRPGARIQYSGDLLDGTFSGNALSSIYMRNPELNYLGSSAALNVTLNKLVERVIRGLGLNITDTVMYYPEQPVFVTPESAASDFTRGIQARRNNSLTNVTTLQGTYAVSPSIQMNASYSFQTRRYFSSSISGDPSAQIPLFNNTSHSISVGPMYRLLPHHSVGAAYSYRHLSFESAGETVDGRGASSSAVINGGMVTWKSEISRELTAELSPGVSVAARAPDNLTWTMHASLQWAGQEKTATIFYNRGLYPSYFVQSGVLVSNVAGGTFTLNLTNQWSVTVGFNYALNTRTGQERLSFESVGANGTLRYEFYPGVSASITGNHNDFTINQSNRSFNYNRQTTMLLLTAEWN